MFATYLFFLLLILALCPLATIVTPPAHSAGCLDRRDSAAYLSISTRLLDDLAAQGKLPRVKIGRKTLFRIADLDAFVDSKVQRLSFR